MLDIHCPSPCEAGRRSRKASLVVRQRPSTAAVKTVAEVRRNGPCGASMRIRLIPRTDSQHATPLYAALRDPEAALLPASCRSRPAVGYSPPDSESLLSWGGGKHKKTSAQPSAGGLSSVAPDGACPGGSRIPSDAGGHGPGVETRRRDPPSARRHVGSGATRRVRRTNRVAAGHARRDWRVNATRGMDTALRRFRVDR